MQTDDEPDQSRSKIVQALASTPDSSFLQESLASLNAEAVAHMQSSRHLDAIVTYGKLNRKLLKNNLTHAQLYTCYNNQAGAYLHLHLYQEALQYAEAARRLAEAALKRTPKAFLSYVKSYSRKANALIGLERYREASHIAEQGLRLDPFNLELKQASEEASRGILKDLMSGKGREILALPNAEPTQRITYHPHSAPLHKIKTDNMLPNKLLTPFQAESDHHVRDTYNYMTVQTDIAMPKRQLKIVEDLVRQSAWATAIKDSVRAIVAEDKDCRVLDLAAGAGLHAMTAMDAGAHHVTAVERWLYLSLACKESLTTNGFTEDRFKVVYKRPTDLSLKQDVPILCNLLLCDMLDEGLLASGIIPTVQHCLNNLLTADARVIPASATVYAQAAEVRMTEVCGFDVSAVNRHRWHPGHTAGTPLADNMFIPLSEPMEVWHFDMLSPPEESNRRTLDVTFNRDGKLNAVVFWYELRLTQDIVISTKPVGIGSGMTSMGPAVQYLAGEMLVEQGSVMPLLASHNTVRMRFDIEQAEYLHLAKPDATFPVMHFSMLADQSRNHAYQAAIARVVKKKKASAGDAHAVDVGTGSGLLAMMAATAGADTVVACDLHESLCDVARQNVAANGLSERVSVVHRDIGLLQRGREVRALGANVAIADIFDAGLMGHNFLYLLEAAKKNILQPGCAVVPCAASLYVMGINIETQTVAGYDLSGLNKYRWDKGYETCQLDALSHTCLTKPCKVFEYFFEGERKGRGRDNIVKLDVIAEGAMNAVAFWFDLHLDEEESLCSGPSYIVLGGAFRPLAKSPGAQSATATEAAPEAATEAAPEASTEAASEAAAEAAVEAAKEAATGAETRAETEAAPEAATGAPTEAATRAATAQVSDSTPSAAVESAHTHAVNLVEEEMHVSWDAAGMVQCETKDADDHARKASSKELDSKTLHSKQGSLAAAHGVTAPTAPVDSLHDGKLNDNASCAKDSVGAIDSVYIPATAFAGARADWVFKLGHMGLGYYPDAQPADSATACKAYSDWSTNPHNTPPKDCTSCVEVSAAKSDAGVSGTVPKSYASSAECAGKSIKRQESSVGQEAEGAAIEAEGHTAAAESEKQGRQEGKAEGAAFGAEMHTATAESEMQGRQEGKAEGAALEADGHTATAESEKQGGPEGKADQAGKECGNGHYWGQALQYLDSSVQVTPGKKVMLLARRDGAQIRFSLRAGTGSPVAVAPWKEEWGGGASVENPHFQRVHYCELLVQDFLMRVRSNRFPSIEEDMKMLQAHCGSLLLDPALLAQVYHEMVVLEQINLSPDVSPGVSLQAITSQPLMLH